MSEPEISKKSVEMIERLEITSEANYFGHLQHLTWPGGASGVTGGIGYDFGYETAKQIADDWYDLLTPGEVGLLCKLTGRTGDAARRALSRDEIGSAPFRAITIDYEAAIHVFEHRSIPRYLAMTLAAFPGAEGLSPDSLGALVSLVYNRGPNVDASDRRREMHGIRAVMSYGNYAAVPEFIRSMKRLWEDASGKALPGLAGLLARRDEEATLFESGLDEETTDLFIPRPPVVGSAEQAAV